MRIYSSDWLTNAGIVGFIRIQEKKGINYNLSNGYIEINPGDFDGFPDAYFVYILYDRINTFFPSKIFNRLYQGQNDEFQKTIRNNIRKLQANSLEKFKPDWSSYSKTTTILKSILTELYNDIVEVVINVLSKIETNNEIFNKKVEALKTDMIKRIDELTDNSARYIYTLLQRFYFNKKVVGNPSFVGESRIISFEKEYVVPAQNILKEKTNFQQITCKFCKQNSVNIESFDSPKNFFNEGMFRPIGISLVTFTNFFYNSQPDLVMCELCELLLLCTHAGFNQIPYEFRDEINSTDYIFVNLPSLELLKEENNAIRILYKQSRQDTQGTIYEHIIGDIFAQEKKKKSSWAIHNILFIEIRPTSKNEGKPIFRYFHVGKDIAEFIFR